MTGPEHYEEAERLLQTRERYFNGGRTVATSPPDAVDVARAQAHATLALAAATAARNVTELLDERAES